MLRLVNYRSVQFLICFVASLLLRVATFGDPNLHVDEAFYLLVGQEMHHGAVPYVDIWDRKPLGLFLIYWVFAAFPNGVLAYQLGACLAAALTAFVICQIARRWLPPAAATSGGLLYLAMLGPLLGFGGQSPVFYNTLVAAAALLVIDYLGGGRSWRLYLAMLLLGSAIAVKQTATFEAIFFGLAGWRHHADWRKAAVQIMLGALPFCAIAGWYVLSGHWPAFYGAMVTANTNRPFMGASVLWHNAGVLLAVMGAFAALTAYAILFANAKAPKRLLSGWLMAALLGFCSVPYLIDHYALPLLVPMTVIAAGAVERRPLGPVCWVFVCALAVLITGPQHFTRHQQSRQEFERMAAAIGDHHGGLGLLVFDGPSLLYSATNSRPPSPLVFPMHLNSDFEKDVGPRRSGPELDRILAGAPDTVVMREKPITIPPDEAAFKHLIAYVNERCRPPLKALVYGPRAEPPALQLIYTGCGRSPHLTASGMNSHPMPEQQVHLP